MGGVVVAFRECELLVLLPPPAEHWDHSESPDSRHKVLILSEHCSLVSHSCLSFAVMKHRDQKASWGGKGVCGLHVHIAVHH